MSKGALTTVIIVALVVIIGGAFWLTNNPAPTETPTPVVTGQGDGGGGEDKPEPATGEPITMGATFPLTGDVASYGISAKRGLELAVSAINAEGGVLSRPVEIEFQDDINDSTKAVSIVTKYCSIDRYPVIFGSAGSTVTLAVAPIANENKTILISPISSSATLSTEGGRYFYRTCPADDQQAEILANWVADTGALRVAIVYTNNSWGLPLADGFTEYFEELGGTVLISEGLAESATDTRPVINRIMKLDNVYAIVSPTYPKEGAVLVKQTKELGLELNLFGGDNWGSPEFLSSAGNAAEGVMYTAPTEGSSPDYLDFADNFEKQFGIAPDVFSAYAYDAGMTIFSAVNKAGTLSTEAILAELAKIDHTGVSGRIAFRPNGDLASDAFAKMIIESGQPKPINSSN